MGKGIGVVVAAALALTGCQTDGGQGTAQGEPPPANYRQIAIEGVKSSFFDPYSIRDAEIAPPKRAAGPSLNEDGFTTPWVVCVRANAKNRMGGYIGKRASAFAINGGKVVNVWTDPKATGFLCDGLAYEPFPEIEEGYKPPAAQPAKRRG